MPASPSRPRRRPSRQWVLTTALVAGLVTWAALPADPPPPAAAGPDAVAIRVIAQAQAAEPLLLAQDSGKADAAAKAPTPPAPPEAPAIEPPKPADAPAPAAGAGKKKVNAEIQIDDKRVTVRKHGDAADERIVVGDREFDSFEQFVEQAPWLAVMVIFVVGIIFLSPVLIIALVIWYRMRRARLLNEALLRLAEKGVVAPGAAMEALASGRVPSTLEAAQAPDAPLPVQAAQVRKRVAWSDLRKGVVMAAIGLALVFYSMINRGSANGLGLVLLFVGIGYVALWYFEERQFDRQAGRGAPPAGGA